jgi:hypothetical protein
MKNIKKSVLALTLCLSSCAVKPSANTAVLPAADVVIASSLSFSAIVCVACLGHKAVRRHRSNQACKIEQEVVELRAAFDQNNASGKATFIELLATVNSKSITKFANTADKNGCFPLHKAAMRESLEEVRLLLDYCTDGTINQIDDSTKSPFAWACLYQNQRIARLLLPRCTQETIDEATAQHRIDFLTVIDRKRATDDEIEVHYKVARIPALMQGYSAANKLLQSCSFYAIYFAHLFIRFFEGNGLVSAADNEVGKLFKSQDYFEEFLKLNGLFCSYQNVEKNGAVGDEQVEKNAKQVSSKITVTHQGLSIQEYLDNKNGDYQVFIYNKSGHWIALGLDYRTNQIYCADSLARESYRYSWRDRDVIHSIHHFLKKKSKVAGSAASV